MANPAITRDVAEQVVETINQCLRDGFRLCGMPSAKQESGKRLGIPAPTVSSRLRSAKLKYGLSPDPTLQKLLTVPPGDPAVIQQNNLDLRRYKDEIAALKSRNADLERSLISAESWRESVLGLSAVPQSAHLCPPILRPNTRQGRTVILHLSDIHYGETVSLDEMDGLNRYDAAIARARLGRYFATAAALMTDYWLGKKPDEIILCLGGDLISGGIHDELLQTNAPSVPHTVRDVGDLIAEGIALLAAKVKSPIRVYSVPGNHGRTTHKPQSKGRAVNSLDLLATDFAEASLRKVKNVTFHRTVSPDAYFATYGWHWLLTHGDTMGGRGGGTGFIGPMSAIIKGHRKLVDTSWRAGRPVHYVLTAHYHTTGKTTFGWANGSVVSYGEYARDLRADPEPSRQNMLVVHPEHGVINEQPLYLGHPSEGSLYAGPATVVRPSIEGIAA